MLITRRLLAALLVAGCGCLLFSCRRTTSAAADPVSYGRQIAPIFALHCNGCHGGQAPSSSFRTADHAGLRAGGVLGDDIVPGQPDQSMVVRFIEGFRGPDQRMPLGAPPLTPLQVGLIRNWIGQGASNDHAALPCYQLRLPVVRVAYGHPLIISAEVSESADLLLSIRDHDHSLYSEEASVKQPPEQMDAGAPNQLLNWKINSQANWPLQVSIEVSIRYASGPLTGLLRAIDRDGSTVATRESFPSQCSPD